MSIFVRTTEKEEIMKDLMMDIIIESYKEKFQEGFRDLAKDFLLTFSNNTFEHLKSASEGKTLKLLKNIVLKKLCQEFLTIL